MSAEPTPLDDWFLMNGDQSTLVCTKAPLDLMDDEVALARVDGPDVVLTWSKGCYRVVGMARTGIKPGSEWMISVVDLLGRPVRAMEVRTW